MNEPELDLIRGLADAGFRSAVVSATTVRELSKDLESLLAAGELKSSSYDAIKAQYGLNFTYEPPIDLPTARSVIITAAPQPKTRVGFSIAGKPFSAIIPPTYIADTDGVVLKEISEQLSEYGYKAIDAVLPGKRLAVRSGLASYGRNNITYIEGLGSYFRLRAYFSDMPSSGNLQKVEMMGECRKCTVCSQRCPTEAISKERFVIDARRCLTFLNEGDNEFPDWIDPSWHNCLIGCMVCQDVCPANKGVNDWIVDGEKFDEKETEMILEGVAAAKLPEETALKLKRLYMLGDERALQRNLRVLMEHA